MDEGRATAHNVSSVAGGGPAMMWHCSDPPHVFFGLLRLLLHPSHAAPLCDGPSPCPPPPRHPRPQNPPPKPCQPGPNRPSLCSKPELAISHIKVRFNGPLGIFWPSPAGSHLSHIQRNTSSVTTAGHPMLHTGLWPLTGSLLLACTRPI